MVQRLKGALLLLPLIFVFFLGEQVFSLACIALGTIAFLELTNAFKNKNIQLSIPSLIITVIFLILCVFLNIELMHIISILLFFFAIIIIFGGNSMHDIFASIFGLAYSFLPFTILYLLYSKDINLSILVFVVAFVSDVFAYFCGKLFGKHKLIPQISPNKTIEGSVGAIIFTFLASVLFAYFAGMPILKIIFVGMFGSSAAQLGDLFASAIKRHCGIKDFGKIVYGHGGILDRFDSVMFVALLISFVF